MGEESARILRLPKGAKHLEEKKSRRLFDQKQGAGSVASARVH
jgi:hypothetical protein